MAALHWLCCCRAKCACNALLLLPLPFGAAAIALSLAVQVQNIVVGEAHRIHVSWDAGQSLAHVTVITHVYRLFGYQMQRLLQKPKASSSCWA